MYDIVDICRTKTKDEVFAELERIHPLPDLEFAYGRINELIARHDLFAPNILKTRVPLVSEDEVVKLLSQGIMQLCLEVTEACNMRCKYCAYSGGYPYNRRHGSRYMDFGTAKAAIDYFLPRASSEEGVAIGFYGGEPLLNFKLIRECVEYIKSLELGKTLRFSLTTNLTLLTEEILDYFTEEGFNLTVSLDGPQTEHDRNRIFKNGEGSFAKVMENLQRIYARDHDYYLKHISFNAVYDPTTDLLAVNRFFTQDFPLFNNGHPRVTVGGVTDGNPTFLESREPNKDRDKHWKVLRNRFLQTRIGAVDYNLSVIEEFIARSLNLVLLHKRCIRRLREYDNLSSTCIMGQRRLFVTVDGKFHTCERINNRLPIGDVHSGFDIPRITKFMNEYAELMNREDCLNCWATRFCGHCYATVAGDRGFLESEKQKRCKYIKNRFLSALILYCSVLEKNQHAFDYMDDIVMA